MSTLATWQWWKCNGGRVRFIQWVTNNNTTQAVLLCQQLAACGHGWVTVDPVWGHPCRSDGINGGRAASIAEVALFQQ
jgi:hypothetical protein